ncbi:MAG: DNA/RNA helicase domain-containing protein [Lachnospiraceae bacterium]
MARFEKYEDGEIDDLFRPKDFLISPLNTPKKFINNKYFLTQQQEQVQKEILESVKKEEFWIKWGITGKAGTGKTLLLYDLAKECVRYGRCCIIHSGILCEGHNTLNRLLHDIDIISAKHVIDIDLTQYNFIFIDETQRIYTNTLERVLKEAEENNIHIIFSYDKFQTLSHREENRKIVDKLHELEGFKERVLSDKIRTNKEISSFIRLLIDLRDKPKVKYLYKDIDILFANDISSAQEIIDFYRNEKSYVFINYTQSMYKRNTIDMYEDDINTHHVIGQEFDNVLIMLDHNFRYNQEGRLQGKIHPNPDYLFYKLFYQGVSRAREKLCILVVENEELFSHILSIKSDNRF